MDSVLEDWITSHLQTLSIWKRIRWLYLKRLFLLLLFLRCLLSLLTWMHLIVWLTSFPLPKLYKLPSLQRKQAIFWSSCFPALCAFHSWRVWHIFPLRLSRKFWSLLLTFLPNYFPLVTSRKSWICHASYCFEFGISPNHNAKYWGKLCFHFWSEIQYIKVLIQTFEIIQGLL